MSIYRIIPDSDEFNTIRTLDSSFNESEKMINQENLKDKWRPIKIGIVKSGKSGDFFSWAGEIVCNERAYHILNSFVGESVEFLPLIEQSDLNGAWMCLNSSGRIFKDLKKAVETLAEKANQKEFSELAAAWLALDLYDKDGF